MIPPPSTAADGDKTEEESRTAPPAVVGPRQSEHSRYPSNLSDGELKRNVGTFDRLPVHTFKRRHRSYPVIGSPDPKVLITVYSDLQCPFCSKGHETVISLLREYSNVALIFRHYPLPFHQWAFHAAKAVECAARISSPAYWSLIDFIYERRPQITRSTLDGFIESWLVMNIETEEARKEFAECRKDRRIEKDVDGQMAEGKSRGMTGTPHFFFNDRVLKGAQPLAIMRNMVDDILAGR